MLKFVSLGSGSSGNCYYLHTEDYGVFIDMGIGRRLLRKHLNDLSIKGTDAKAILITHDHTDHVKSVGCFACENGLPVYTSEAVHLGIERNHFVRKKIPRPLINTIHHDIPFQLGPLRVTAFELPHDSAGNNGYFIETPAGINFCIATDVGHTTQNMITYVQRSHYLVIESNYDPTLLNTGPYPPQLKRRIASGYGHLSNHETAQFLQTHLSATTRRVFLCHLSEENNHPELARITIANALNQRQDLSQLQIEVLKRKTPSLIYEL